MRKLFFILAFCPLLLSGCSAWGGQSRILSSERLYLLALEEYTVHNFDRALTLASQSRHLWKKNVQAEFLEAKIYFFKGDFALGQKRLLSLTRRCPEFTEARIWSIRCLLMQEDFEAAEGLLKKEIAMNATDWRIFYLYSILMQKLDRFDEELTMLKNAELSLEEAANVYAACARTWGMLGMEQKELLYMQKARAVGSLGD